MFVSADKELFTFTYWWKDFQEFFFSTANCNEDKDNLSDIAERGTERIPFSLPCPFVHGRDMESFWCPFQLYPKDFLSPCWNWLLKRWTFGSPFTSRWMWIILCLQKQTLIVATFIAVSGQINCLTFYHFWLGYELYIFWLTFLPRLIFLTQQCDTQRE